MFDTFTFFAQIVNFLILVWLLKRFLYTPITRAMDKRESDIKEMFDRARGDHAAAQEERALLENKLGEIESIREKHLEALDQEVESLRSDLIAEARHEVHLLEKSWKESLTEEKERFSREFRLKAQGEVLAVARRLIQDLADSKLESLLIQKCLSQVKGSIPNLSGSPESILIRTTLPVSEEDRRLILSTLCDGDSATKIEFETTDSFIAGVEVVVAGHKATWTAGNYLDQLESSLIGGSKNA